VQLVADMNGKQASEVVDLVQDAEIRFHAEDGRLHHEGLRIGLPDIDPALVISSRGSVGLDQTLDLHVELPRLDPILRKEKGPAICRISGTIGNPKVSVQDASLVIRQHDDKEPIIAVHGVNLNMQVENTASGYVLAVEPVEIFKNEKLSAGLAAGLVQLVLPDLASDRQVAGEMSLSFETLRIPLGASVEQMANRLVAAGKIRLRQVALEAKFPMSQALLKVLADMHGKPPSNLIHLIEDSEINFRMRDGRLHHDGLRLGFPEIDPELVVNLRGSIGLDETLDLHLELPGFFKASRPDSGPIQCHITGTIRDPKISLVGTFLVAEIRLARHSEEAGVASSPEAVSMPTPVRTPEAQPRLLDAPREVDCVNDQCETTFDDAGCLDDSAGCSVTKDQAEMLDERDLYVSFNSYMKGGTKMASLIPWRTRNGGQAERAPMLNRMGTRLFDNFRSLWPGNGKSWPWGLDIEETEEAILVKVEAPGFEPGDFDLQVRDNELVLKASKKIETKDKEGKVKEVPQRECYQSVKLPSGINQEKVDATYRNGILTVTFLKTAEANGKKITVKSV
jgi:HSP20 family molecular chaperone IbpA